MKLIFIILLVTIPCKLLFAYNLFETCLFSATFFNKPFTSSTDVSRFISNTQSVKLALASGNLTAIPSSNPVNSGKICVIAFADPVDVGTKFVKQLRVRRTSFLPGHAVSSGVCVFVKS